MAAETPELRDPESRPFATFRFIVEITGAGAPGPLCGAAFSDCDGLEMTIEPKTIREGGRNCGPVHFSGPVSYAQLSLKRGMTRNFDLWKWFARTAGPGGGGLRATATVVILSTDGAQEEARFVLGGCLPVKLKAPALNAKDGLLAIEEMQIAYETLTLQGVG